MTNLEPSQLRNQNRRAATIYGAMAIVSLVGLFDSIYLAIEHVSGRSVRCTNLPGCSEVLSSRYASFRGIPLSLVGAASYFVVFSLATLSAFGYRATGKALQPIVACMFLTSLWLVYLQAYVIKAFCEYCLLSAAVTLGLSVLVLSSMWGVRDAHRP